MTQTSELLPNLSHRLDLNSKAVVTLDLLKEINSRLQFDEHVSVSTYLLKEYNVNESIIKNFCHYTGFHYYREALNDCYIFTNPKFNPDEIILNMKKRIMGIKRARDKKHKEDFSEFDARTISGKAYALINSIS